jgi:hypothetical protein
MHGASRDRSVKMKNSDYKNVNLSIRAAITLQGHSAAGRIISGKNYIIGN